jgi:integrase
MVDARERRCLPVENWPASDRTAWAAAHRRGSLLEDDGRAVSWAPATSDLIARGYGRFLSFLARAEGLDDSISPGERITRRRVESYIAQLREENHSSTVAARIRELSRAYAVMAPDADWTWLRRISARLRRAARPAWDDRLRLVPVATILDLGLRLMHQAEARGTISAHRRALGFRDGLIICVLAAIPLRARNVAGLSLGTSLQRRGEEWWVAFGADATKNRRPIEMPLPVAYTEPIERYIQHHRPQLVGRSPIPLAGDAFWVGDRGKPLIGKKISERVTAVTKRELGSSINVHLFRKIASTELAIRDAAHVAIAQPLLGHADYRTTQRAYILSRSLDAARKNHEVIQSIRAAHHADEKVAAQR